MAKLINVYRADDIEKAKIERRQIPLITGENMMMLMDLNSKGLIIDCPLLKGKPLDEFTKKFNMLSPEELQLSLEVEGNEVLFVLGQSVQCVGCRRSVESLYYELTFSGYPTLEPLVIRKDGCLSIVEEKMKKPQGLGTILYKHKEILDNIMENKLKNRNTTRCILHSRDALRSKLFSETWREIWSAMKKRCREELTVIETQELSEVLEDYLKKHKFCQECKTKVEKAYKILVSDTNSKEKGFVPALYSNIRKCLADNHIHIETKFDFIDMLIHKAETEINGSYLKQRERHAKTLEIAQKEILTCIGMIIYERLKKIYVSLREEERACQVLAAVGVHALSRSFNSAVERKQGISNLELCYQEISRAEKAKELKREQRKLKKKKKKIEKKRLSKMECGGGDMDITEPTEEENLDEAEEDDEEEEEEVDLEEEEEVDIEEEEEEIENSKIEKIKSNHNNNNNNIKNNNNNMVGKQKKHQHAQNIKCDGCSVTKIKCPCDEKEAKSLDGGYSSDPSHLNSRTSSVGSSSLEGSDVSCNDGICNHSKGKKNNYSQKKTNVSNHIKSNTLTIPSILSLEQMLNSFDDLEEEDDGKNCYIPDEVVLEYKCRENKIKEQRAELRENLRKNFAEMCIKTRGICKANN